MNTNMKDEIPHAYDDEELKEHMKERPIKNMLERINADNFDLIGLCLEWTDYLCGKRPKPTTSIGRSVNPKLDKMLNRAEVNLTNFVSTIIRRGEGRYPYIPILIITHNTCLTLIDRLGVIHRTKHLIRAEEAIDQIFYFARYDGNQTMAQAEYEAKLNGLLKSFIDACEENAHELTTFLDRAEARMGGESVAALIHQRNNHEIQLETILKQTKSGMHKDKRDIVKAVIDNRTGLDETEKPTHDPRELQRAAVRRIMQEAVARKQPISLHEACYRAWTDLKGGYKDAKNLYVYCNAHKTEF